MDKTEREEQELVRQARHAKNRRDQIANMNRLRDQFAMAALPLVHEHVPITQGIADEAYLLADAMLVARNKALKRAGLGF